MTYTREQVEQAGEDWVRERVAEAKGWRLFLWPGHDRPRAHCPPGAEVRWCNVTPTPYWPRDIASAWELVDEIATAKYLVSVYNRTAENGLWVCDVDRESGEPVCSSVGDTAPIAICKAWLLWRLERPSVQGEGGNVGEVSN